MYCFSFIRRMLSSPVCYKYESDFIKHCHRWYPLVYPPWLWFYDVPPQTSPPLPPARDRGGGHCGQCQLFVSPACPGQALPQKQMETVIHTDGGKFRACVLKLPRSGGKRWGKGLTAQKKTPSRWFFETQLQPPGRPMFATSGLVSGDEFWLVAQSHCVLVGSRPSQILELGPFLVLPIPFGKKTMWKWE